MSSFVFFKIPYEGKIESVYKLLRDRDWISSMSIKVPEEGIIFLKVPFDLEEEVSFNQNLMFDESTKTKFGVFQKINESDFEAAQNLEKPKVSNTTNTADSKEEEKIKLLEEKNESNIQDIKKKIEKIDNKINTFNKEENKNNCSMCPFLGNILGYIPHEPLSLPTSVNIFELGKSINSKYKEPYDCFFSQSYLIVFFIFAIICLIVFRL